MKKIFVYIPTASIVTGGGEVFPLLQAKYLALKGFEVTLCCLDCKSPTDYYQRFKKEMGSTINFLEINIENDDLIDNCLKTLDHKFFYQLYGESTNITNPKIATEKFDLALIHYLPGLDLKVSGAKIAFFLHGTPSKFSDEFKKYLEIPDFLIADSYSIKNDWSKILDNKREIIVIPNGIESKRFTEGNVEKDIDIFFVGRLIEIKGVEDILVALKYLKDKYSLEPRTVIGGNGPLKEKLISYINTNELKNVELIGYVPDEDLINYYQRAKIALLPSFAKEGVITTMLESSACGTPVITCNCCGMPDFINNGENGILVEPRDTIAMGESIRELLKNNLLRVKLGTNARKKILEGWDWTYIVDKLVKSLYE